ncbi:hypothetical protein ACFQZC_03680 [Streptacidiphilus monticola]
MSALAVLLALVCAAANGTVSVLQRLAAVRTGGEGGLARLVRCGVWWLGCVALAVAGITQVAALAVGSLSLVQPLLAAELLFTLLIGGLVFHRSPGGRVWAAFLALACGLAVFLVAVDPQEGASAAPGAAGAGWAPPWPCWSPACSRWPGGCAARCGPPRWDWPPPPASP